MTWLEYASASTSVSTPSKDPSIHPSNTMSRVANSNVAMRGADAAGNPLTRSEKSFLQQVARQRVTTYDGHTWEYFDCGKLTGAPAPPLVCLPGTSGSPRCFHLQMLALAAKGCRLIAVRRLRRMDGWMRLCCWAL